MKVRRKPTSRSKATRHPNPTASASGTQAFAEHLSELRRRLYYVAGSIIFWGGVIYSVQQHVVAALLKPSHGQHFIYTSPGGGIDFLFRICVYGGIVLSLPVIVYNLLRFFEPVMGIASWRFVALGTCAAGLLALAGTTFGYFVGLPAALHFLLHQFTTVQIQPLVTIQAYLGFVIVYMVGSALLFQLPLLLIFINRIKPLKPQRLLHYERWVILVAFILAGLMNPTPNIISQLLVAGPFIIMYQVGIGLIALINRNRHVSTDKLQAPEPPQPVPVAVQAPPRAAASGLTMEPVVRHAAGAQPKPVRSYALPQARRQTYLDARPAGRPFSDIHVNFPPPRRASLPESNT